MAPEKTTRPNTTMCFMGYEIDSIKSEIPLRDKMSKYDPGTPKKK